MAGGVRPRADARAPGRARRAAARLPRDPRGRHERQVDRDPAGGRLPAARGAERRRVHLAARGRLERADPGRRRGRRPRAGARARAAGRRACGRDPVRGADGRRAGRVRGRGRRGRGGRSRPRRPARRDQRPRGRGGRADERRARPHRRARRDARGDRRGEAGRRRARLDRRARRARVGVTRARARRRPGRGQPTTSAGPRPRRSSGGRSRATSRPICPAASTRSATTSSPAPTTRPGSSGCSSGSRATTTWSSPRSSPTRTPRRCWPRSRRAGDTLVATASRSARALPADELAARARPFFERVEPVADPAAALERGRELAGEQGAVLVTGSLYLLADLTVRLQRVPWGSSASA